MHPPDGDKTEGNKSNYIVKHSSKLLAKLGRGFLDEGGLHTVARAFDTAERLHPACRLHESPRTIWTRFLQNAMPHIEGKQDVKLLADAALFYAEIGNFPF